jgi:flagellar motor switch protein FliG
MSERGAQMLVEEMEFQPPQRKRVVEEAQGRIVAIVAASRKPARS